jgi:hypothetical protein
MSHKPGYEDRDEKTIKEIEKREAEAILKVDKFIQQMEDLEIQIDTNASNIPFKEQVTGTQTNLSQILSDSIEAYRFMKNGPYKGMTAENCLKNIETAYSYGMVKEGTGLSKRVKILESIIATHEDCIEKLQKLSADYLLLKGRKDELEEQLNRAFKSNGGGIPR